MSCLLSIVACLGLFTLADAAQRAGRPADAVLDAFTLHAYRSQDDGAPVVEAAGGTQQAIRSLTLAPELLAVRTAPFMPLRCAAAPASLSSTVWPESRSAPARMAETIRS